MAFDLNDHMAKMTRTVSTGERDGAETVVVHVARTYSTHALDLWDAVTNPERLSRWFLPVSGDLTLGGRYQLEGNASGTIEACDPPERLEVTWEYGGGVSWLTVRFVPEPDGTRLELEHEAYPMPGFSDRFGPGAVGVGWDMGFLGLARHLGDPEAYPTTPEADGWATSPEAMAFYRSASDAWGRSAIEAGTPASEATTAAEATRAFYAGESPASGEGVSGDDGAGERT